MKLMLATACQLVIQDQEYGHSLIGVFHDIQIKVQAPEVPSNAIIPKEWAIFSKWRLDASEVGGRYKQITETFWPDGSLLNRNELAGAFVGKDNMAFIIRNPGFPIGQSGTMKISLTIEDNEGVVCGKTELEVVVMVQKGETIL